VAGGGEWQTGRVDVMPIDAESPEKVLRIEDERRGIKARELKLLDEDERGARRIAPLEGVGEDLRGLGREKKNRVIEAGSRCVIKHRCAKPEQGSQRGQRGQFEQSLRGFRLSGRGFGAQAGRDQT
jgi:hypothetical protein